MSIRTSARPVYFGQPSLLVSYDFCLLRLLDVYESNTFQRLIYPLNKSVRALTLDEAKPYLESALIRTLAEEGVIAGDEILDGAALLEFESFKGVWNRWTNSHLTLEIAMTYGH